MSIKKINGWSITQLNELVYVKGRVGWKGYRTEDLRPEGPIVIGASHIDKNFKLDLSYPIYLSREKYIESPEIFVQKGDIVFVQRGSLGKLALIENDIGEATINPSMVLLKPKMGSTAFIYQYLCSDIIQQLVKTEMTQTGVPMLSQKQIGEFKIHLPPLPEQRKIAKILSTWDELIEKQTKLIAAKEKRKKALMQVLLTGEVRFKGFRQEWEIVKLIDVADKKHKWSFTGGPFGSNLKASDYTNNGIRIIQLQNIGDGQFLNNYKIFTSKEKADELVSCNIYPDEIILSKMGDPVARACMIPSFDKRFLMASDGIRLKVNESEFDPLFVLNYINFNLFRDRALELAIGSTRKRIGLDDLKNIPFPKPTLSEQKKIAKILFLSEKEVQELKTELEAMQIQKKGLMQQLLTGKIRVKV